MFFLYEREIINDFIIITFKAYYYIKKNFYNYYRFKEEESI